MVTLQRPGHLEKGQQASIARQLGTSPGGNHIALIDVPRFSVAGRRFTLTDYPLFPTDRAIAPANSETPVP